MVAQLTKGDNVVTSGGIHGRIYAASDDTLTVEIADNVRVTISRDAVTAKKA
jgi:preprotein translocase subunit YajC